MSEQPSPGSVVPEEEATRREKLAHREELVRNMESEIGKYDRAVLAIAAAFLTISLSFVSVKESINSWLILVGWVCLAAAVIGSLACNLIAWFVFHREGERESAELRGEALAANKERTAWPLIVSFNIASGSLLVAGIAFLVAFGFYNLDKMG